MAEIKKADLGDLTDVFFLESSCFSSHWPIEILYADICLYEHPYFILREKGAPVGYAGMSIVLDEAHLRKICVTEPFRRRGYGGLLLHTMIDEAKGCGAKSMTLEVRRDNAGAIAFYEGFGFEPAGIRKKYYENKGDALIMWNYDLYA